MKNFGFAVIAASGLSAAILGLAAPAQAAPAQAAPAQAAPAAQVAAPSTVTISAGVDHLDWLDQIHPKPMVPKVDTTVRHSGAR